MTTEQPRKNRLPWIIAGAMAAAIAVGLYLMPSGGREQAAAALRNSATVPEQVAFFDQIEGMFPGEYNAFLDDMVAIADAGDPDTAAERGFAMGGEFTAQLRRDNAPYLATAPLDALRDLNRAALVILEGMADDPALCGQFALGGGASLTLAQAESLDMAHMADSSAATFRAIAAGRDTPVDHPEASDSDIVQTLSIWQSLDDVTPDMILALKSGDPAHPQQCDAQLSFQRFIIENTDPIVERAMIRLVMLANGI